MTWRRGEAGSTLIDRPKDAPVPDFTNGKERVIVSKIAQVLRKIGLSLQHRKRDLRSESTCHVNSYVIMAHFKPIFLQ